MMFTSVKMWALALSMLVAVTLIGLLTSTSFGSSVRCGRTVEHVRQIRSTTNSASANARVVSFAIVEAVFSRPSDPGVKIACLMSFTSIVRQTYPHWILVLVGDGLTPVDVGRVFNATERAGIPKEKIIFQNMDEALREKHIYKNAKDIWPHAGTNAVNLGLRIAYNLSTATHIARIDDDDYWYENHLQNLADAYTNFPNASFAYSQAIGYLQGEAPFPASSSKQRFVNQPPAPCALIHATTSWAVSLRTFYRQAEEQMKSQRASASCCWMKPCPNVLPDDADMWDQVREKVLDGNISSVFVNTPDVHYSGGREKICLPAALSGTLLSPECAKHLDHVFNILNSTCL